MTRGRLSQRALCALACSLGTAATALAAPTDATAIVRAGVPVLVAADQSTGWTTEDGWLQGAGTKTKLVSGTGLGAGDFELKARLAITGLGKSAAAFTLADSAFGFEGAHGKVFITGPLFDYASGTPVGNPADFLKDGQPFDFVVRRQGRTLSFAIDGKTVHSRPVGTEALGRFGFIPWRATMRIQELTVSGAVDPAAVAWKRPVLVRQDGPVKKTVLLPPGPGNPRNSEGDFIQLKDGRILFVYTHFTGGGGDHDKAHLAGRYSSDGGDSWTPEDTVVLPNEGNWNVMSVSLLRLADGRIALFYLRKNSQEDCRPQVRFSTDEAQTWSAPLSVIPDAENGYYVLNNDRVVQLTGGRLVVPVALHHQPGWAKPDWAGEITCYLSDDAGATWRRCATRQKAFGPDQKRVVAQEPGVVELKDGRVLLFARTNAGVQYLSWSADRGETWSPLAPSSISSPTSPASIERVPATGDLLLVWNNHEKIPPELKGKRTPFTAAVSKDEGKTWTNVRVIEDDPTGWYCYTAIEFSGEHVLLGHCCRGLAASQITRFPVSWLYETAKP